MNDETKLKMAFQVGLGLDGAPHFEELEFSKTAAWDSIAHMRLIAAIEEAFAIRLTIEEILGLSSYPVAKQIVAKHL